MTIKQNNLQEQIDYLETMRRDFVANVSHELRTPLTVIRGYLETLIKKIDTPAEMRHKIYNQMHQHSLRMERIIDDLLLLSRLESTESPCEVSVPVPIAPLLKTIQEDARRFGGDQHHTISLVADEHLKLLGSKEELTSLFSNLIINAVKYTPALGQIDIRWHQQGDQAVFEVEDTGIGIAAKHIPRITERFYRIDKGRSRDSGGTGLGLAIVKHVLLRHDAELEIDSTPQKGSIFRCHFHKKTVVIQ